MGSDDHHESQFDHEWEPSKYAISFDSSKHPSGQGRGSIIVSHPTAPFVASFSKDMEWSDAILQNIAHVYLLDLSQKLEKFGHPSEIGLPKGWLEALDPKDPGELFGWLPIVPPFPHHAAAKGPEAMLSSHRLLRRTSPDDDGDKGPVDTTVILVAAEKIPDGNGGRPTNSDFGLRVVMHLASDKERKRVLIAAMTASLPYGPYRTLLELKAEIEPAAFEALHSQFVDLLAPLEEDEHSDSDPDEDASDTPLFPAFEFLQRLFKRLDVGIATTFQLKPGLSYEKLRFLETVDDTGKLPPVTLEARGKGIGALSSDEARTSFGFIVRLGYIVKDNAIKLQTQHVAKRALISDAAAAVPGIARVFEQDPASWRDLDDLHAAPGTYNWHGRRPTRSEAELDSFRRPVPIGTTELIQLETADFAVRNCPNFVHTDPDNNNTKEVRLPVGQWPPVRANDHSAISAYWNCDEVFGTMRGFGLDPSDYFEAAEHGLDVFYRSGISPGPGKDGQTINARVKLQKEDNGGFLSDSNTKIEVHLALANFSHRARWVPADLAPTWAEPLGIATSERWMWHEFGHVLIAARLGELEFQFAHSAGDGMAAVWADPFSRLADPRDIPERFRDYTFPWVFLTRKHTRCVLNGWSWTGSFQLPVTEAPEDHRGGFKGYLSEQILSSTLFRLYRVLGGDTIDVEDDGPDYETRQTASLVSLYLMMQGIESFAQPPVEAGELETAMIVVADLGLITPLTLLLHTGQSHDWKGGLAHKAIRWAFEAQGMHWDGPVPHNAPGTPPEVDIYIEDRRPREERTEGGIVQHGPGGYVPVSIDWADEPQWQMGHPGGQLGTLPITVRNRGSQPATNVSLRAWFGLVGGDPGLRGWDRTQPITWSGPIILSPPTLTVSAGGETEFTTTEARPPLPLPGATRLLLLIEATCPDDRANSDPAAGLPCAVTTLPPPLPREVADLVANDNNLGLLMVTLP